MPIHIIALCRVVAPGFMRITGHRTIIAALPAFIITGLRRTGGTIIIHAAGDKTRYLL